MLKKNETIEILKNGGHISINEIYRSATVYSAAGDNLGRCRYDTAEKIGEMDGYENKRIGTGWEYTRRIMDHAAALDRFYNALPDSVREYVSDEVAREIYNDSSTTARAAVRGYRNQRTGEQTQRAALAMVWHRAGDAVTVSRYLDAHATKYTTVHGARVVKPARDENRDYCRHIAQELEKYAAGNVARCPECGEIHEIPDTVGDKFRCPSCRSVGAWNDWEILGVWDFLADSYDIEYRCDSRREYRSVRVMVACGGPNIYIDTAEKAVLLYWWTDFARYSLDPAAVEAVNEWAEEYWNL